MSAAQAERSAAELTPRIAELGGWRSETLARVRRLIREAPSRRGVEAARGARVVARQDRLR